jgi:hypothetical protein
MNQTAEIIKHEGKRQTEQFRPDKLHASVYAACLSIRTPEGEASHIAKSVSDAVASWCNDKPEVTSDDLRRVAANLLETFQPEAAYLYKHHRLVI